MVLTLAVVVLLRALVLLKGADALAAAAVVVATDTEGADALATAADSVAVDRRAAAALPLAGLAVQVWLLARVLLTVASAGVLPETPVVLLLALLPLAAFGTDAGACAAGDGAGGNDACFAAAGAAVLAVGALVAARVAAGFEAGAFVAGAAGDDASGDSGDDVVSAPATAGEAAAGGGSGVAPATGLAPPNRDAVSGHTPWLALATAWSPCRRLIMCCSSPGRGRPPDPGSSGNFAVARPSTRQSITTTFCIHIKRLRMLATSFNAVRAQESPLEMCWGWKCW